MVRRRDEQLVEHLQCFRSFAESTKQARSLIEKLLAVMGTPLLEARRNEVLKRVRIFLFGEKVVETSERDISAGVLR
jgi:hypothetical protein